MSTAGHRPDTGMPLAATRILQPHRRPGDIRSGDGDGPSHPTTPPARWIAAGFLVAAASMLAGCSAVAVWHSPGPPATPDPAPDITIAEPADGATKVPTSTAIAFRVTDGSQATVAVTDAEGSPIEGKPEPDGTTWRPGRQLHYNTRYRIAVTATVKGVQETRTTSFTTMTKPSKLLRVSSALADNELVGVGMPLIVTFAADVPAAFRAEVQSRLTVTSNPPQEGAWSWINGHEVHFRPREYWKSGSKLTLHATVGGVLAGDQQYLGNDLNVNVTIGRQLLMKIENATKQLTVIENGQTIKTIAVSLGKPSTPSSSGNMIIMSKHKEEWFDSSTFGVPATSPGGYRTKIQYTQRLTWGGEYIHAAPWSEADQGHRNVSHGCTNVSQASAAWLYDITRVGDPVIVTGTERRLAWGDGYTDWNVGFEQFARGSALASPTAPGTPAVVPPQN